MIQFQDIHPLTEFQRNAKKHIERLKATGRAEVLTVNGRAELIVQDAGAYQNLLDLVEQAETIKRIHAGLESMKEGKGQPAVEVLAEFRRKYNIPSQK